MRRSLLQSAVAAATAVTLVVGAIVLAEGWGQGRTGVGHGSLRALTARSADAIHRDTGGEAGPGPATAGTDPLQTHVAERTEGLSALAAQVQVRSDRLRAERRRVASSFGFRIGVFNILGSNHTGRGGDARGYASGGTRAGWAADLITGTGLDLVGLSEVQGDQLAVLNARAGGYDVYPGGAWGNTGTPTSVMWRSDRFSMVSASQVVIPFVGQRRPMPLLRLQERATSREFYVLNAHNGPQGRQSERDAGVAAEISALRGAIDSGLPVFFLGDLNEKDRVFCKVTGQLPMHAANGGSTGSSCSPPGGMRIDWIFGTTAHTTFSGYSDIDSSAVRRVTDHHLVVADVSVSGGPEDRSGSTGPG